MEFMWWRDHKKALFFKVPSKVNSSSPIYLQTQGIILGMDSANERQFTLQYYL